MGKWYEFGRSSGTSGERANIDSARNDSIAAIDRAKAVAAALNQTGATDEDFDRALAPLREQLRSLDGIQGLLSGLEGDLSRSALSSTANAGVAAVNAARLSGGGRFGQGGNASAIARRGAVDAAVSQSAALSDALVRGRVANANFQSGILQQRGNIAGVLSNVLSQQVGFKEQRSRIPIDLELQLVNTLAGFAGIDAGIATGKIAGNAQTGAATIDALGRTASSSSSF